MKSNDFTPIPFGTDFSTIIAKAKKEKATVIVYCDHYRGNCKGYFFNSDTPPEEKYFHWNTAPEDRGATQIFLTPLDVPFIIQLRCIYIHMIHIFSEKKLQTFQKDVIIMCNDYIVRAKEELNRIPYISTMLIPFNGAEL